MRSNWQRVGFYVPDTEEATSLRPAEHTEQEEDGLGAEWNGFPQLGQYAASVSDWWKARHQAQPSLAWPTKVIGSLIPWICQNWLPAMFLTLLLVSVLFLHRP